MMTRETPKSFGEDQRLYKVSLSRDIWLTSTTPATRESIIYTVKQHQYIPCAIVLHAEIDPFSDSNAPNREMLDVQALFFSCPNLRSFTLSLNGGYGGCMPEVKRFPKIHTFQLTGQEFFPPLEELSLSAYVPDVDEQLIWRARFPWSGLRSLSLGPRRNVDFLDISKGHIISLRTLRVETYYDQSEDECLALEVFLRSFDTLESLSIRGHFLSSGAFSNHPNLKHFCLHTHECPYPDETRLSLSGTGLYDLDLNCPQLESLEINVQRDGEWPVDILGIIAAGFDNLRHLTLHFEVGIQVDYKAPRRLGESTGAVYEPIEPVLNESSAKELGRFFFALRSHSKLETLTLKTGERLRRFPQMAPFYTIWERSYERVYKLFTPSHPGDEPSMEDLTEPLDNFSQDCASDWLDK